MKKLVLALAVAVVAGGFSAQALAVGRLADVTVTDRSTGATLPVHYHLGEYWVAGAAGAKYAIDIRNASGRRVLAVTSVDGVNVVSGETASTQQSGYVFSAWQRYGITGWRKSNTDVAAFEFTASPNSYAERTGRPRDVGVIGVALFKERERERVQLQPSEPDYSQNSQHSRYKRAESAGLDSADKETGARFESASSTNEPASKRAAPQAAQSAPKLGTGHGERENSYVSNTEFERASNTPAEVIRIRYDSYANLLAMGVVQPPRPALPKPNPFPDSTIGFVPDPPLWR